MNTLVHKLKARDEKALIQVMDQYIHLVVSIVNNVSKGSLSKEDVEETVSDVFVTLWNNTHKIEEGKLKGYICCIARTRTLNKIATCKNNIIVNIDDYDIEEDFSIEDTTEQKDIERELRGIISEIAQPDREILIRHYYYCETVSVISQTLNINIETVKSKLRRTRNKIKSYLIERGYTI